MKTIYTILMILLGMIGAFGQSKKNTIGTWFKYKNDSLKIRWMPLEATQWEQFNAVGYNIERAIISKGKVGKYQKLNSNPILPLAQAGFNSSKTDTMAAQVIHNNNAAIDIVKNEGQDAADKLSMRHFFAMLVSFKSYETAQKMGLGFTDLTVQKGQVYAYKIYALSKTKPDTSYFVFNSLSKTTQRQAPRLEAEEIEKAVFLKWPAKQYLKHFAMYHIERSEDGKNFKKITDLPIAYSNTKVDIEFYKDSIGVNYKPYAYRLVALDFFGEWHTSPNITVAQGVDKTPPSMPKIESSKFINQHTIEIKWSMPIVDEDLKGFYVSSKKGLKGTETKSKLLSKSTFSFQDNKVFRTDDETFLVYAVDTAGNEKASLPIYIMAADSIPPSKPIGLKAEINTKGHFTIKWKRNTEKDLNGYYVYMANDLKHEFSLISNNTIKSEAYTDSITLKSLTKQAYIKIVAEDTHFNRSEFSDPIEIKRPDIIKPEPPSITKIELKDNKILLTWNPSMSNDVENYEVYRKESGKTYDKIGSTNSKTLLFEDYNSEPNKKYFYAVKSVDQASLLSEYSLPKGIESPKLKVKIEIPSFTAAHQKGKGNMIKWLYENSPNSKILVYRIEEINKYKLIWVCPATESQFLDPIEFNKKTKYAMRVQLGSGRMSEWSPEIQISK